MTEFTVKFSYSAAKMNSEKTVMTSPKNES